MVIEIIVQIGAGGCSLTDAPITYGSQNPIAHHRDVSGGRLRPAVFGAMDGLVTNVSLIAGVGGGGAEHHTVILSGLAGLVAGAFSMATGEYTSVKSQNELVGAEVEVERTALATYPVEEQQELAAALVQKGIPKELAIDVAKALSENPKEALQFHSQEELGVNPNELPSPYDAGLLSFVSCALGALVPLLPYLFGSSQLWISLVATSAALAFSGGMVAHLTERPILFGAFRQVALAVLCAGVTYGVGRGIGAGLS
jgi:VIT1/CCC1 family predicted Fe2+/Mn2+ transporter